MNNPYIIYTYKWILNDKLQPDIGYTKGVGNTIVSICKLSVEQANKYGTTILFCDEKSAEFWNNTDVPFSKIEVLKELDELDTHHWGLHKLLTMSKFPNMPYIHIDMDIILLNKPKIHSDYDVTFGFPVWDFKNAHAIDDNEITYVNDVYVNTYNKWHKKEYSHLVDNELLDFGSTPSMCYIQVNNQDLIRTAVDETIEMGQIMFNNPDPNINQYLEQCIFFTKMKEHCVGKWRWYSDDYTHLRYDNIIGMSEGIPLDKLDIEYLKNYDWVHLAALNQYDETDVSNLLNRLKKLSEKNNLI